MLARSSRRQGTGTLVDETIHGVDLEYIYSTLRRVLPVHTCGQSLWCFAEELRAIYVAAWIWRQFEEYFVASGLNRYVAEHPGVNVV